MPAPQATVTTTGTIDGRWSGLVAAASQIESGPRGSMLTVVLTPTFDPCGALAESMTTAGHPTVALAFAKPGATPYMFAPGTDPGAYSTDASGPPPWVEARIFSRDASCTPTPADGLATGVATLITAGGSGYTGTFDVTLIDGEHLSGTFGSEPCSWTNAPECR
jgi:hypothetical protein